MRAQWVVLPLLFAAGAKADDKIALIEFYGYQGINVGAVRLALPVHEGDLFDDGKDRPRIRDAVKRVTGADPTDVAPVCCEGHGHTVLFIGLPGKSSAEFRLNPQPAGKVRLPAELLALSGKLDEARTAAIEKGGDAPQEDDSQGYPLIHYAPARALQLQLRDYTRAHEPEIYDVLEHARDNQQRSYAAIAVGYAQRSPQQTAALVRASRDSDPGVRDEATRAIGVLLRADASTAKQLRVADFIEMSGSGWWMDRNKSSMILLEFTQSRDPQLLAQIESRAGVALLEMARWRDWSHAYFGRMILGRIHGIAGERLTQVANGTPEEFLAVIGVR